MNLIAAKSGLVEPFSTEASHFRLRPFFPPSFWSVATRASVVPITNPSIGATRASIVPITNPSIGLVGMTDASRVRLFLLDHFLTNECDVLDFCLLHENGYVYLHETLTAVSD